MTKRVAILYNSSWYVYLLRRNLIRALQEHGCDVSVLAPTDAYTKRVTSLGVTHIPIDMSAMGTNPITELQTLVSIYSTLRKTKPDAVLSFTVKCNLYAGLCRRTLPFTQIANISGLGEGLQQGGLVQKAVTQLYSLSMAHTDKIFFQNAEDLSMCVQRGLTPLISSTLIPGSGVDLQAFTPRGSPDYRLAPRTFLMFGRLLPKKGFYSFINAARALRARYGDTVAFWIMGSPDSERPESEELLEAVLRAHAEQTVRYLQNTDDVRPVIQDAHAVVLPSTYNEGIPRSLLEALAMGKPIITTDWKGCRDTVRNGHNGFLCHPDDDSSLIKSLDTLINTPREQLETMGIASRRLAEEAFDERIVLSAYLQALGFVQSSKTSLQPEAQAA